MIYSALVIMGWLNIYSSSLSSVEDTYQKQFVFILLTIPFHYPWYRRKFYEKYASIIFVISLLSLAGLFLFGKPSRGKDVGMQSEVLQSNLCLLKRLHH
jgi:rod shape determining protein RodA